MLLMYSYLAAEVVDNDCVPFLTAALDDDDDVMLVLTDETVLLEGIKTSIACCLLWSAIFRSRHKQYL